MRQQGIGSYLVQSVVNDRIKNGKRAFQLAVDKDNDVVRTLYEKMDFKVVTEICYYTA
ncbi:putative acetyltransferase [Chlamydia trachomatis]|nr:putative acetyltransferase [Chlamydia trachomatis]